MPVHVNPPVPQDKRDPDKTVIEELADGPQANQIISTEQRQDQPDRDMNNEEENDDLTPAMNKLP